MGLGSITFVDRNRGWAVGARDVILHTEDRGASWQERSASAELPPAGGSGWRTFGAIRFVDADRGAIIGTVETDIHTPDESLFEGFALLTSDGGETWRRATISTDLPLARVGGVLYEICFTEAGIGLVAGNPPLLSRDAGKTWVNIEERVVPGGEGPRWNSRQLAPLAAACVDHGQLWLATVNEVYGSNDGGTSWEVLSSLDLGTLGLGLVFENRLSGWLSAERLLQTIDGGVTWTPVDNGLPVEIPTLSTVYLSETDLLASTFNAVSVSADAGATWELVEVIPLRDGIFALRDAAVIVSRP